MISLPVVRMVNQFHLRHGNLIARVHPLVGSQHDHLAAVDFCVAGNKLKYN
jgi:hypothetical protein